MDQTPLINLPDELFRLVKVLPAGENNAMTSSELASRLAREEKDPTNYQLRQAIKELIVDHAWPVGSCHEGYYLIETNAELQNNLEDLRGRKRGIQQRIRGLRAAWKAEHNADDKTQGQLF